jgi:hypothetical protein
MLIIKSDENFTDTSLPILRRDKLIEGDNGGVLYLADFSRRYSFAGAGGVTPPAAGEMISSLTEANPGSFQQATIAPTYAGNGVDFSPLAAGASSAYVEIPAAVCAAIRGDGVRNQYFLMCCYVKLPTLADWNAQPGISGFFSGETAYNTGPDLAVIAQQSAPAALSFRRQTAAGVTDILTVIPTAGHYGQVAQLALWRNATGQGAQLRTVNGTMKSTMAVGANNTQDFSTKKLRAGVGTPWTSAGYVHSKWKLYRCFVEDLLTSGRNPETVLDADYARVVAAGLFA